MSLVQKNVQLSEINVKNFERHYPKTSLSWALDLLLEKFLAQHSLTPAEYAQLAVDELKDEISGSK